MTETLLRQAMARITADTGKIQMGRGKLYTTVASRIEAMRYVYGEGLCIETEILVHPEWRPGGQNNESVIVVRASILTKEGIILSTGHAEEVRGSNRMTETSALEVCETSAIGRALASLGLHGGEYASVQEIEIATNKPRVVRDNKSSGGAAKVDPLPDNGNRDVAGTGRDGAVQRDAPLPKAEVDVVSEVGAGGYETASEALKVFAVECEDTTTLRQFWAKNKKVIEELKESAPDLHAEVKAAFSKREKELKGA